MDRPIVKNGLEELLRTSPNDYSLNLLRKWLAFRQKGGPQFPPEAIVDIPEFFRAVPPKGENEASEGSWDVRYAPNWLSIRSTTVGRFIANNLVFSRSRAMREAFPYYDKPWNDKTVGEIQQRVIDMRLAGKITHEDMAFFVDRMQWLGYAPTCFLAPSMTIDTIRAPKSVKKLKSDILKSERGQRVQQGDLGELGKMEKELVEAAKKELDGKDPGFDIFASGARGSVGNNFKNVALLRGAIRKSDDPSKITVSTSSLEEGIPADEMHAYADLIVQASYGRSMMTAQGGYIAKQLNAAFQGLQLDPDPNSDCRTSMALSVTVDSPREYLFRFYKEGSKLVEVMPDDLDSIKGKTLKFRSPLYCGNKGGICAKCAGTLHHRMGIQNIGLIAGRIGTTLMNASLKAFHDSSLKRTRIDFSKYVRKLG
jgi:hypothetical protein